MASTNYLQHRKAVCKKRGPRTKKPNELNRQTKNSPLPLHIIERVGRTHVTYRMFSKPLAANRTNRQFCHQAQRNLLEQNKCSIVREAGGLVAVYAEKKHQVLTRQDKYATYKHMPAPGATAHMHEMTVATRVEVRAKGGRFHRRWTQKQVQFPERLHVCQSCGGVYFVDVDNCEYRYMTRSDRTRIPRSLHHLDIILVGPTAYRHGHTQCCLRCWDGLVAESLHIQESKQDAGTGAIQQHSGARIRK